MKRYMLDTNTVGFLLRGHAAVSKRVMQEPMESLCISAVTEGEMLFGVAKRPEAKRLKRVVEEFLLRVETMPWNSVAASCYGTVRADLEQRGKIIAPLDLLIASHALSLELVLVTNDRSFGRMDGLAVEDWVA
jgi:tRNA(fMet)-specific endonuclease VapC